MLPIELILWGILNSAVQLLRDVLKKKDDSAINHLDFKEDLRIDQAVNLVSEIFEARVHHAMVRN